VLFLGGPLSGLSYADAFLTWSLVSLAALVASLLLVTRNLGIRWDLPKVLLFIALALSCGPLNAQLYQGQLNLVLLLLMVGVWAADRHERPILAGVLLGLATVLKIYPGFLFIFFVLRRRWRVLSAGVATAAVLTAITLWAVGTDGFRDYVAVVMPTLPSWRSSWGNLSVYALWSKLFNPAVRVAGMDSTQPILRSPPIATLGTLFCDGALIAIWARMVVRARQRQDVDCAFALSLPVMLLVTPDVWSHYFVVLLLPIVLLWTRLPVSVARVDLLIICAVLWLNPEVWWYTFIDRLREHGQTFTTPLQTLTALSIPTYALVGLVALGIAAQPASEVRRPAGSDERTALRT
jgi:hypothetical protein